MRLKVDVPTVAGDEYYSSPTSIAVSPANRRSGYRVPASGIDRLVPPPTRRRSDSSSHNEAPTIVLQVIS